MVWRPMQHDDVFRELTSDELTRVAGGFLPLLGLLGAGSGLVGQILGGIGQKKAQQAQQIMGQLPGGGADQSASAPSGGAAPMTAQAAAPTGAG